MSIRDEIKARVEDGRLSYLPHSIPGISPVRTMFVSEEVGSAVCGSWDRNTEGVRFGLLRAQLDVFTAGGLVSVALDPFKKAKAAYLAAIDPVADGVWDIRSFDPSPAIRVLGCFAEMDVFVALVWDYRKNLGGPKSKEWRDLRERCKTEWRKLFPSYPPLVTENVYEYLSGNIHLV